MKLRIFNKFNRINRAERLIFCLSKNSEKSDFLTRVLPRGENLPTARFLWILEKLKGTFNFSIIHQFITDFELLMLPGLVALTKTELSPNLKSLNIVHFKK